MQRRRGLLSERYFNARPRCTEQIRPGPGRRRAEGRGQRLNFRLNRSRGRRGSLRSLCCRGRLISSECNSGCDRSGRRGFRRRELDGIRRIDRISGGLRISGDPDINDRVEVAVDSGNVRSRCGRASRRRGLRLWRRRNCAPAAKQRPWRRKLRHTGGIVAHGLAHVRAPRHSRPRSWQSAPSPRTAIGGREAGRECRPPANGNARREDGCPRR